MNSYKAGLIKAAHGALDALTEIVNVTTPENQVALTPVTTALITATSDLLDLIQGAPATPPTPQPATTGRNR